MPEPVFDLDGGRLCLDFANTASQRSGEHLAAYADLVAFARQSGLLTQAEADRLRRQAARQPEDAEGLLTRALIGAAGRVDVLLVAYGAPRQEEWLDRNLAALGIPVGIGVGGVFNYLAGDAPRAPRWVRRIHFEWLHRLITQPWRWRRQLALPQFAALAVVEGLSSRRARRARQRRRLR